MSELRKAFAIAIKDLKDYFRSKQDLFWMFGFPLMFMVIFGWMWSGPLAAEYALDLSVVNFDHEPGDISKPYPVTSGMLTALRNSTVFTLSVYNVTSMPLETEPPFINMSKAQLDAIMIIPPGFSQKIAEGKQTSLRVILNEEDPTTMQVNLGMMTGFLKAFVGQIQETGIEYAIDSFGPFIPSELKEQIRGYLIFLGEPVKLNISTTHPTLEVTQLKFFLPGMMGFILLMTGVNFSAIPIADERDKGSLQRLLTTPTSAWTVLAGKALAVLVAVALGIVAVAVIGVTLFNVKGLYWRLELMIPAILLSALNSIGVGLIFSSIAKDAGAASGIAITFNMPLQFFIGLYFPLELFPEAVQAFAHVFPLTYGVDALRKIMLYNAGFDEIAPTLAILAVGALVVFGIGVAAYNWATKKLTY